MDHATDTGTRNVFRVFGAEVRCRTMPDGERIIEPDSIRSMIDGIAANAEPGEIEAFADWQRGGRPAPSIEGEAASPWLKQMLDRVDMTEYAADYRPPRRPQKALPPQSPED